MHTLHPLESLLRGQIAARGPLTFYEFMETALYHPEHGYYMTLRGFGPHGDFITSAEEHPLFGALLGRQVAEVWQAMDKPRPFRVLEYGGGSGALARALVDWLRVDEPMLAEALQYTIQERSPSLRALQQAALYDYGVGWGPPGQPQHVVVANEVLDAFPVHRVLVREGALRELRVGLTEEGAFTWVEGEDLPAEVQAYFEGAGVRPPEGAIAEVNLGPRAWVHAVAAQLPRGLALVLDYGHPAEELLARRYGTLLTYYRHTLGSDPLVRVGRQDISTHVDFSFVARAALRAGFEVLGLTTQRALLHHLGFQQAAVRLRDPTNSQALARLVDPKGLGGIKALFLARDLEGYVPTGLVGGRTWPDPPELPRLPPPEPPAGFLELWREAFGGADTDAPGRS